MTTWMTLLLAAGAGYLLGKGEIEKKDTRDIYERLLRGTIEGLQWVKDGDLSIEELHDELVEERDQFEGVWATVGLSIDESQHLLEKYDHLIQDVLEIQNKERTLQGTLSALKKEFDLIEID